MPESHRPPRRSPLKIIHAEFFFQVIPRLVQVLLNQIQLGLMGELIGPRVYSCCKCRNHVSLHDDIISKGFQGKNGRAFLFSHAMNIVLGTKENRNLITGLHTVADVHCADCLEVLGWKYEQAFNPSQKYKEGKFVLEKFKIVKENW